MTVSLAAVRNVFCTHVLRALLSYCAKYLRVCTTVFSGSEVGSCAVVLAFVQKQMPSDATDGC
eukprot:4920471-Amphidinium_carterae.1